MLPWALIEKEESRKIVQILGNNFSKPAIIILGLKAIQVKSLLSKLDCLDKTLLFLRYCCAEGDLSKDLTILRIWGFFPHLLYLGIFFYQRLYCLACYRLRKWLFKKIVDEKSLNIAIDLQITRWFHLVGKLLHQKLVIYIREFYIKKR